MQLPRTLRKGLLSIVFGTMVAQGVLPAAEAQAQTAPVAGAAADDTQTAASRDLARMRDYYQRRTGDNIIIGAIDSDRLFVQDPAAENEDILRASIIAGGHTPNDAALTRIAENIDLLPGYYTPNTGINLEHQTMSPVALSNLMSTTGQPMCVIVASQPDISVMMLGGLSVTQATRYVNRHEFYHCMHAHLDHLASEQQRIQQGLAAGQSSPRVFDFAADVLREETRADLGAVMDMIALDGDGIGVIYAISSWRSRRMASEQSDVAHYSSPVLDALAQEIQAMGIERFRRMSETARINMADRLMQEHSLSGGAVALLLAARLNVDEDDINYTITDRHRAQAASGLAFIAANPNLRHADMVPLILAPAQVQTLNNWDITAELERRATGADGNMTLLALLGARADILDGLRADLRRDPSNPIHGARIVMVHTAVQNILRDMDTAEPTTMAAYTPPPAQPAAARQP